MKPSLTFWFPLSSYTKEMKDFFGTTLQVPADQSMGSHLVCRNFSSDPHELTLAVPGSQSDKQEIQFHVSCSSDTEILRAQVVYNFAASIKCEFVFSLVETENEATLFICILAPCKETFEFLCTLYDRFN
jgi:hypothetical protein